MHMILTGTPIPAVEAHAANLVSGLHEPGTVLEKTIETASKLASLSPTALSLAKEAVCRCKSSPVHAHIFFPGTPRC